MPKNPLINRILVGVVLAVVLMPIGGFVYTRFLMPQYHFGDTYDTMTYKDQTYVRRDTWAEGDVDNVGKIVGIAVPDQRSIGDYIWPFWVMEYTNDMQHITLFVRGLMDTGSVYAATAADSRPAPEY